MDIQYAIIDKTVLHNEGKYLDFIDRFVADFGQIKQMNQRKIRYQPDKVLLEIEMGARDE